VPGGLPPAHHVLDDPEHLLDGLFCAIHTALVPLLSSIDEPF